MALQAAYKQFLAAPNPAALAANASLHYITTTTSVNGPADIVRHLSSQRNLIKKKEDFIDAVEGTAALAVEAETSIEFLGSGSSYLPGLDDNFLADRGVDFVVLHVVKFDAEGKIQQIRQSWDQGSLLKQLDIIGKTGRNWPIRDGRDQIKLVTNCLKSAGAAAPQATADTRSRGNSTNILRDPHASLALFAPREEADNMSAAVISPYAGNRPRQRDFAEILGDEPVEEVASPTSGRERPQSPNKAVAPKIGSSKNFQPIRLFESEEEAASASGGPEHPQSSSRPVPPKIGSSKNFQPIRLFEGAEEEGNTPEKNQSPDRFYRPNPKKYQHFDFADGSDPQDAPKAGLEYDQAPKTKHDSTWSFNDFVTPQKAAAARPRPRAQDVRHWGDENEAVSETTSKQPAQLKPRRDAETHFEFVDDGGPTEPRLVARPRGTAHNTGLGLYQNNLYSEEGSQAASGPDPRALGNITNLKDRRKDFDAHFDVTDEPPTAQGAASTAAVSDDRMKAVKMMESNWASYDESPASRKENNHPTDKKAGDDRGITIAGDSMGGKKGAGRAWGIGDDDDETRQPQAVPGRKQGAAAKANSSFWDF